MRLSSALSSCLSRSRASASAAVPASLCLVAVTALAPVSPAAAVVPCTAGDDGSFPLDTRVHGGPATYEAGGAPGTWYIDLVNSGSQACAGVHPVVVLVDDERLLRPSQAKLDFYDGHKRRPVRLESTDQQELVGVVGADGFAGYTVAPGKTVTVKLRLMITSDAFADHVTAKAALVQRRGQDGEWVGESEDYVFDIDGEEPARRPDEQRDPGRSQGPVPPDETSGSSRPARPADTDEPARPVGTDEPVRPASTDEPGDTADPDEPDGTPVSPSRAPDTTEAGVTPAAEEPSATESATTAPLAPVDPDPDADGDADVDDPDQQPAELARTGQALPRGLLAAVAALLVVLGATALLLTRRRP
ncbi:hypothetical protein ACIPPM_11960 [Streptomyces sp. NPDC090119]|uniref:hypothetical protein n=1 Tax=Streptomyces sp. NPDC090119 TaxID=3365951 RepID=UPI003821FE74